LHINIIFIFVELTDYVQHTFWRNISGNNEV